MISFWYHQTIYSAQYISHAIYHYPIPVCSYIITNKRSERVFPTVKWEKTVCFRVGVAKTRTNVLFSRQPISWIISTQTQKSNSPIANLTNLVKSSIPPIFTQKHQYRTQYRKTPLKSTLSPIIQPKSQPTIQTTFFPYKYKNPKKITTFTD